MEEFEMGVAADGPWEVIHGCVMTQAVGDGQTGVRPGPFTFALIPGHGGYRRLAQARKLLVHM
jgi:hypothetical protein